MTRRADKRMPAGIDWVRVYYLSITGFLLIFLAAVAHGGTLFDEDGNKIDTCKGSTCSVDSGTGGNGGTGQPVSQVVTQSVTVSPSSKSSAQATSSAKSASTSRSASSSSATGGKASAKATGGKATATGGSSSATNGNQTMSVTVQSGNTGGADLSKMVPDVYAPGLTTSGDDMCVGSASGGLTLSGIGALFGMTTRDSHCRMIKGTKLLMQAGMTDAALRRMCMDDEMREAIGDACPPPKQETAPSSSSSFTH